MVAAIAASVLLHSGLVLPDGQNFVSASRRQALLHAAGAASLCFFPAAPSLADATGKGVLQFDEEGKLIEGQGVQEETSFRTVARARRTRSCSTSGGRRPATARSPTR